MALNSDTISYTQNENVQSGSLASEPKPISYSMNENISNAQSSKPIAAVDQGPDPKGFKAIGRISKMRPEIDQPQYTPTESNSNGVGPDNISTQLKLKMNVIDLIPCMFDVGVSSILNPVGMVDKISSGDFASQFMPKITYQKPISDFQSMLLSYGLPSCSFLRLYLTDSTSTSDDMQNSYTKNIIDSGVNSLSSNGLGQLMQMVYQASESTGNSDPNVITGWIKEFAARLKVTVPKGISSLADLAAQVLTHGTHIAFPKIWSSSSYTPNISANVKLVSPYGHPKAVNEFIIKPLAYLLILLSPTTSQGITTYRPNYLTLKSYGLSNLTLCYPASLTIRRGGDDNSYNNYNQPLTIEVSLVFDSVTEGFACYKNFGATSTTISHPESQIFAGGDNSLPLKTFENDFSMPSALFPTLKNIVNSFRPFGYTPGVSGTGLGFSTTSFSDSISSSGVENQTISSTVNLTPTDVIGASPITNSTELDMIALSPPTNPTCDTCYLQT